MFDKDQDTVKVSGPASKRHGSVWGDGKRQDALPLPRGSPADDSLPDAIISAISPTRLSLQDEVRFKRREAAKWIAALTGEQVPHGSDLEFRAALRDGVLLCRIMNEVAPGSIKAVHMDDDVRSTKQRFENVQGFMAAAIAMGVPTDYMLSMADLESEAADDRPRVFDCILWLKRLHSGLAVPSPAPPPRSARSGAQYTQHQHLHTRSPDVLATVASSGPDCCSPRRSAHSAMMRALVAQQPQQQAQRGGGAAGCSPGSARVMSPSAAPQHPSRTGGGGGGLSDQINVLQGMSNMLREKMSYSVDVTTATTRTSSLRASASSGHTNHAMDAMGPVLEQVLGNLTQEYERRLLSKDQEIQAVKERLAGLQREMGGLNAAMGGLRRELEASQAAAARDAAAAAAERLIESEAAVAALQAALDARSAELAELRGQLAAHNGEVDAVREAMVSELQEARERLATADAMADSYRTVQEENRRLYNTVQDLRGAIRVFCRIRPPGTTGDAAPSCVDVGGEQELAAYDPRGGAAPRSFRFDRVFADGVGQQQIYDDVQPLIRSVLDGYNVCIFAYGQTGSGKTHTMTGTDVHALEGRGINYRALDDLFALRGERSCEVDYEIRVQMLEIYNETLRDLLVEGAAAAAGANKLDILNTQASGCNVPGSTKITVRTTDDVMEMMARGARNRHSAETKMNARSSRSHQVLTVIVDGFNRLTGARTHGCLHLIDLAGSERTSKSEATGDRMVEANHINTSLSALGSVMAALASKSRHVPFRDSKLTQLLADSLSGAAKVMMFVHIAPEASSFQESSSTLKFAERVAAITLGEAKKNAESGEVYRAHEEICRLRSALEQRDAEVGRLVALLQEERAVSGAVATRMARLEEAQAQMAAAALNNRRSSSGGDDGAGSTTPYHSALGGGSSSADPKSACANHLTLFSPASGQRLTPGAPSPFSTGVPPMQTIREDMRASISGGLVPALQLPPTTPNSARSSGLASGSRGGLRASMSMRDGGRWGSMTDRPVGSSSGIPARPSPSLPRPPTAPSNSNSLTPNSRPEAPAGKAGVCDMRRSMSLSARPSAAAPLSARPSTAAAAAAVGPTASARSSQVWGRSSGSVRGSLSLSAAVPPPPAAEAGVKARAVPASGGGVRSGTWAGSSARPPAAGTRLSGAAGIRLL